MHKVTCTLKSAANNSWVLGLLREKVYTMQPSMVRWQGPQQGQSVEREAVHGSMEDSWRPVPGAEGARGSRQGWEWNVKSLQLGKKGWMPGVFIFCWWKKSCPQSLQVVCRESSRRLCRTGHGIEGYFQSFTASGCRKQRAHSVGF